MVVVVILSIVCAALFSQIGQMQQRSGAERTKVDQFQEARDFLDQIFRDTSQMGYPNVRNFDESVGVWQSPLTNDLRLAVGLVKLTPSQLQFEGDVDGTGNVSVVSYMVNGSGSCPSCLQRAQVLKVNGDSVTGQTNLTTGSYSVEVQNIQNTSSIFSAYDSSGNSIALPIDIDTNPTVVPNVKMIQATLQVAAPGTVDPTTGQQLEADIGGRVQVLNCSMATTGAPFTCQ